MCGCLVLMVGVLWVFFGWWFFGVGGFLCGKFGVNGLNFDFLLNYYFFNIIFRLFA